MEWISVHNRLPEKGKLVALCGLKDGHETTATGQLFSMFSDGKPCWAVAHTEPFNIMYWHPLAIAPVLRTLKVNTILDEQL